MTEHERDRKRGNVYLICLLLFGIGIPIAVLAWAEAALGLSTATYFLLLVGCFAFIPAIYLSQWISWKLYPPKK